MKQSATLAILFLLGGIASTARAQLPGSEHVSAYAICAFTAEFDVEHVRYKFIGEPDNPKGKAYIFYVTTNHPEQFRPLRTLGLLLADHSRAIDYLPWNPRFKNETVRCMMREGVFGDAFWKRGTAEAEEWAKRYKSEGWDSGVSSTFWDDPRGRLRKPIKPGNSDWQGPTRYEGPE